MNRPNRQPARARRVVRLFGGAAATLAAVFLAAELLARLVAPVYLFNPVLARDVVVGERYSRLRPRHQIVSSTAGTVVDYTTNTDGYRDLEFPRGHECLVLALGNSFTVNWGVHPRQGWPQRLERELDASPATRGCVVRAAALQGWNVHSAYEAAHDLVPELRPRVLLLMFTQMWTLRMPARRPLGAPLPADAERVARPMRRGAGSDWTALPRRVYNLAERHSAFLGVVKRQVPYLPSNLGISSLGAVRADEDLEAYLHPTLATLDAFADLASEADARLLLAVGPFVYEVDETYRYILFALRGGTDRGFDSARPRRALFAWAQRREVAVIDLLEPVRAAHRRAWAYSPVDLHWNAHGNEVVAERLARALIPVLAAAR